MAATLPDSGEGVGRAGCLAISRRSSRSALELSAERLVYSARVGVADLVVISSKAWATTILSARCKSKFCRMTFEEALAQIEAAVREHGATVGNLSRVSEAAPSRKRDLSRKWCRSARRSKRSWGSSRRRPRAAPLLQLRR